MKNFFKKIYYWLTKPLLWRILEIKDQQSYLLDKMEVLNSPLWDENYYIRTYRVELSKSGFGLKPIDHFLQIGWKIGCNPCQFFDVKEYMKFYDLNSNPLVHFIRSGRFNIPAFLNNPYLVSDSTLNNYLNIKKRRRSSKVVYTCVTNGYDNIRNMPGHYYLDPDWDYICYTDDEELIRQGMLGAWEIRPLVFTQSDPGRINRYHKIFPNLLFPDYNESIYVDTKVNVLTSYMFDSINKSGQDLFQPVHSYRGCLYDEIKWIMDTYDDAHLAEKQMEIYRKEGYPENHGFRENCIIYRKHHNPEIIQAMNEWWTWVRDWCHRDQVSYCYVLWKYGLDKKNPLLMNSPFIDYKDFWLIRHVNSNFGLR